MSTVDETWSVVPGANTKAGDNFEWLDLLDEDNCFAPLDLLQSSKTLDLGQGGYSASLSVWHELLQFTAPDDHCGVVFVRGGFPDNPDAILARAQRRNQIGGFGLELHIDETTTYGLEHSAAQGLINLRWPYTRFNVVEQSELFGSVKVASYIACSFLKDAALYQVTRICPSRQLDSDGSEGGVPLGSPTGDLNLTVTVGGSLRIGCCNSVRRPTLGRGIPFCDRYEVDSTAPAYVMACHGGVHGQRVEMRLWVNGKPAMLRPDKSVGGKAPHNHAGETAVDRPHEVVYLLASTEVLLTLSGPSAKPVVLVAKFSFSDKDKPIDPMLIEPQILSVDAHKYLGVSDEYIGSPTSNLLAAPYRLFTNIFRHFEIDATTARIVGRGVEQIIGISSIPIPETSDGRRVALIKNIVTRQVVNFSSALWQFRLLVKTIRFLNENPPKAGQNTIMDRSNLEKHSFYLGQLINHAKGVCHWILDTIPSVFGLELGIDESGFQLNDAFWIVLANDGTAPERACRSWDQGYRGSVQAEDHRRSGRAWYRLARKKWYCTIIIWYAFTQCPEILEDEKIKQHLWDRVGQLSRLSDEDSKETGSEELVDDPYICMLRWYHHHSVSRICTTIREKGPAGSGRSAIDPRDLEAHVKQAKQWQVNAEKAMRLFRTGRLKDRALSQRAAYLCLLGKEIRVDEKPLSNQPLSCYDIAKEIIEHRRQTDSLEAGRRKIIRWGTADLQSAKPRPAPWELSCLPHHMAVVFRVGNVDEELEATKQFMLADYTFAKSWDQSRAVLAGGFWDFDVTSIICSSFLDSLMRRNVTTSSRSGRTTSQEKKVDALNMAEIDAQTPPSHLPASVLIPRLEGQELRDFVQTLIDAYRERVQGSEYAGVLRWKSRRPGQRFHTDASVQSLEDTPNVFAVKQGRNMGIRSKLQKYWAYHGLPEPPSWSADDVISEIPVQSLRHTSCFDFALQIDGVQWPEIGIISTNGIALFQLRPNELKAKLSQEELQTKQCNLCPLLEAVKKSNIQGLFGLFLLGKLEEHPQYSHFLDNNPVMRGVGWLRPTHEQVLAEVQNSLFSVLNDSMVDLGTRYRVIFLADHNPVILQAMVYMWHTDAVDTFENHIAMSPNISNSANQMTTNNEVLWITSITLCCSRLRTFNEATIQRIEDECDEALLARRPTGRVLQTPHGRDLTSSTDCYPGKQPLAPFIPADVVARGGYFEKYKSYKREELAISIAVTGDDLGRSWTCTILCKLMAEEDIQRYMDEAKDILQMFIHQQYTGRTLVFLMLLGHVCESIVKESERFMEVMHDIIGKDPMGPIRALEGRKSKAVRGQLKELVWAQDEVQTFDDRLNRIVHGVTEAKKKIWVALERGQELRDVDMKRDVSRVEDEFCKRLQALLDIHRPITEYLGRLNRVREGILAFQTMLEAEQSANVYVFTWITVTYLPITLIASLFSMEHHGIVPLTAGWAAFLQVNAVSIVVTFIIAFLIRFFVTQHRFIDQQILQQWFEMAKSLPLSTGQKRRVQ